MAFQCVVVTPEKQAFDETVSQVVLPAHDGLIGILSNRAPLLVKLGLGPLRADLPNGQKRFFYVEGGVAQMKDNRLTLLTERAVAANEIDPQAAAAELAEATARIPTDAKTQELRQRQLDRAKAMQALAKAS
jgi:F-type H+-transporting ATPase subunit epsilon